MQLSRLQKIQKPVHLHFGKEAAAKKIRNFNGKSNILKAETPPLRMKSNYETGNFTNKAQKRAATA